MTDQAVIHEQFILAFIIFVPNDAQSKKGKGALIEVRASCAMKVMRVGRCTDKLRTYTSYKRRTVKAQATLRIRAFSTEPLWLVHTIQGTKGSIRQEVNHLYPLKRRIMWFWRITNSKLLKLFFF